MYTSFSLTAVLLGLLVQLSSALPSPPIQHGAISERSANLFTETIPISINTAIPSTTSAKIILSILQNPVTMITLNPLVKTYNLIPNSSPVTYSVTDKLLTIFSTTYTASFTNTTNGMETISQADGGLTLDGHWSVQDGTLVEEVDVTGSELVIPFVKGEIQSSHQQLHDALMSMAATMSAQVGASGTSTSARRVV